MSIFSRVWKVVVGAVDGQPSTHAIIDNPTTPIQQAINIAVPAAGEALGIVPGISGIAPTVETLTAIGNDVTHPASASAVTLTQTIATEAKTAADTFATEKVGAVPVEIANAAGSALVQAAIKNMPAASNKTEADIEAAVEGFLTDFFAPAPGAAA